MKDYQSLVDITLNKLKLSIEFLEITKDLKNKANEEIFEDVDAKLDERQEIIQIIQLLDSEFLTLFEKLKQEEDFEKNIVNYPKLSDYITHIKDNFKQAYEIDQLILPILEIELENVKKNIKKSRNEAIVSEKYAQESIKKMTGASFGIFIDEMK